MYVEVACPHCRAALSVPDSPDESFRCPECDGLFQRDDPPSLRLLAHPERTASGLLLPPAPAEWPLAPAAHPIDPEVVSLSGALAGSPALHPQLGSLAPTALDAGGDPGGGDAKLEADLRLERTARTARWRFSAGVAMGLAAAALLIIGPHRSQASRKVAGLGHVDIPMQPAAVTEWASAPVSIALPETLAPAGPAGVAADQARTLPAEHVTPSQTRPMGVGQKPQTHGQAPAEQAAVPDQALAPAAADPSSAGPASAQQAEAPPFDREAAMTAVAATAEQLGACYDESIGAGTSGVALTFAPTGRATVVTLEGAPVFHGTPVASCIVSRLRSVRVARFAGDKVTVHTKVTIQ